MNEVEFHQMADQVNDEVSFIEFLYALSEDRKDEVEKEEVNPSDPLGPGRNGWENSSIEAFLEGAAAWAEDTSNRPDEFPRPSNTWACCAVILLMGKYYE